MADQGAGFVVQHSDRFTFSMGDLPIQVKNQQEKGGFGKYLA
jgi:hypothetical protein